MLVRNEANIDMAFTNDDMECDNIEIQFDRYHEILWRV